MPTGFTMGNSIKMSITSHEYRAGGKVLEPTNRHVARPTTNQSSKQNFRHRRRRPSPDRARHSSAGRSGAVAVERGPGPRASRLAFCVNSSCRDCGSQATPRSGKPSGPQKSETIACKAFSTKLLQHIRVTRSTRVHCPLCLFVWCMRACHVHLHVHGLHVECVRV
jgi:hypothetical protein